MTDRGLGFFLVVWMGFAMPAIGAQPRKIVSAKVDARGRMHVLLEGGGEKVVRKGRKEQKDADEIKVANDGSAVGWFVEVENCCTSYPIASDLAIYTLGGGLKLFGNGMSIGDWKFIDGSSRVAYFTDTVHGNFNPACTLLDVRTGKTIGTWVRGSGPLPEWAKSFADDVGDLELKP